MIEALNPLREYNIWTVLVLISETWLAKLGANIQTRPEYIIEVLYNEKNALDQVLRYCKDSHMAITNLQIHSLDHQAEADYAAEVYLRGTVQANAMVARIQVMPGVVSAVDIEK